MKVSFNARPQDFQPMYPARSKNSRFGFRIGRELGRVLKALQICQGCLVSGSRLKGKDIDGLSLRRIRTQDTWSTFSQRDFVMGIFHDLPKLCERSGQQKKKVPAKMPMPLHPALAVHHPLHPTRALKATQATAPTSTSA